MAEASAFFACSLWRFLKFCLVWCTHIGAILGYIITFFSRTKNKKIYRLSWRRGAHLIKEGFHPLEFRVKERRRMRRFNEKPERPLLPKKPEKPRRKDSETWTSTVNQQGEKRCSSSAPQKIQGGTRKSPLGRGKNKKNIYISKAPCCSFVFFDVCFCWGVLLVGRLGCISN